ncbi:hypothetical protein KJ966_31735 [bacterium]|nr:hypothetical protein [bacterium]
MKEKTYGIMDFLAQAFGVTLPVEIGTTFPIKKEEKGLKMEKFSSKKKYITESMKQLREQGWRLRFNIDDSRIFSIMYHKTPNSNGECKVYFSVRSCKDEFSRPKAREALLTHWKNDTHYLSIVEDDLFDNEVIFDTILDQQDRFPYEFRSDFSLLDY